MQDFVIVRFGISKESDYRPSNCCRDGDMTFLLLHVETLKSIANHMKISMATYLYAYPNSILIH